MALVKGPSGLVVDVADEVASGLVGGGHAEYVEASKPVEAKSSDKPARASK